MRFTSDMQSSTLLKKTLQKKQGTGRKRAGHVGACMRER
jgi:hypothetical protein